MTNAVQSNYRLRHGANRKSDGKPDRGKANTPSPSSRGRVVVPRAVSGARPPPSSPRTRGPRATTMRPVHQRGKQARLRHPADASSSHAPSPERARPRHPRERGDPEQRQCDRFTNAANKPVSVIPRTRRRPTPRLRSALAPVIPANAGTQSNDNATGSPTRQTRPPRHPALVLNRSPSVGQPPAARGKPPAARGELVEP